jgi:hypothetical protein
MGIYFFHPGYDNDFTDEPCMTEVVLHDNLRFPWPTESSHHMSCAICALEHLDSFSSSFLL